MGGAFDQKDEMDDNRVEDPKLDETNDVKISSVNVHNVGIDQSRGVECNIRHESSIHHRAIRVVS